VKPMSNPFNPLMTNPVQAVQQLGQSIWYDNISRGLLTSGELQQLIDTGITGVTSNPSIFEKAISGSSDYDQSLLSLAGKSKSPEEVIEALTIDDIRATADLLRPVYDRTGGADGFVSLEVNPHLSQDTKGTVAAARRLFSELARPNLMVKVPATPAGIPAIRTLIGEGININITLIFSLDAYRDVREAYIAGLEDLAASGGDVARVSSVASFFVSRVDTAVDAQLEAGGHNELVGQSAIANAKLAYKAFQEDFGVGSRFASLKERGAKAQRPLWASTGTKNASFSDVLYIDTLIGPDTVNTVAPATLTAFLDHGTAAVTLDSGQAEAQETIEQVQAAGVDMNQVTAQLLHDGVKAFADSFDKLLENIKEKQEQLVSLRAEAHPDHDRMLGVESPEAASAMADLEHRDVFNRIWRKDHTVWRSDPEEISNRLGWLTVTDQMVEQTPNLLAFASEIRQEGYQHVVLLGMGGSSLGPEVLRRSFTPVQGYPELLVLDSTVPAQIGNVTQQIDPARTLFLVSSKSGGTTETLSFYRYFRRLAEAAMPGGGAGRNFVAITDPGTSLETLGKDDGFRRVFLNPPDIGGRYSVLSYFGLVPAALAGIDIEKLLDRADCMRQEGAAGVPGHDNPGAQLGALIGAMAGSGRDKVTVITPPAISSFGLWAEQLIAESLGKEGKGVVPVAGEPLLGPEAYGNDRFFVYLRVAGEPDATTEAAVDAIEAAGHPVARLELSDRYDLGAEFFRWDLATAVAGAILDVHPFDQPDVQGSKDNTNGVLDVFLKDGSLPDQVGAGSLTQLLAQASAGDYLAIMPYTPMGAEADGLLADLRQRVMERHRIATTLGYGPRFLHSTGQLHKGGPASGLYLQLTMTHSDDLAIPGQRYGFATLASAQAIGDFQALSNLGRRAVRVELGEDPVAGLRRLIDEIR
jgi:transaldolase/glucose-6-phosphate isomerase